MRLAILSFAHVHAEGYIHNLRAIPDADVIGFADDDPERGHHFADLYGLDFFDSYEDLIAERPDGVIICSENVRHLPLIQMAAEAGVHVLSEKPLATTLEDAQAILDACARAGVHLMTAFPMRFSAPILEVYRLITSGQLGHIIGANTTNQGKLPRYHTVYPRAWFEDRTLAGGGAVVDHTVHLSDLLRWFLGEVDEVFAYGVRGLVEPRYPADKEDDFVISLKYRSGAIARILGGFDMIHPPSLWGEHFHGVGIGLYGTKASLLNDRIVREYYPDGKPVEERITPSADRLTHSGEVIGFLRHFEECLLNDERPLVDVRDGAQIVAICSACWDSVHSGLPVKVTREFDRST